MPAPAHNPDPPGDSAAPFAQFAALIFDLDGLLIDSEPIWKAVEIQVFEALGVPLTWEMTHQTMGMRMIDVVHFWRERFPWQGATDSEVEQRVVYEVTRRTCSEGRLMPGVEQALSAAAATGLPLAVATSSPQRLVDTLLEHFGLAGLFRLVYSAEHEKFGKPHPAVFLATARKLDVAARSCLVIEDSINGVIAAKTAGMTCIAVPSAELRDDPRFALADHLLDSLAELPALLEFRH